ncbi:MAG: Tex family protein [Verrucomicrobiota bacterium]
MPARRVAQVAEELRLRVGQVQAVTGLLAEGATVPFIARYRKEATGLLDEVAITGIRDRLAQLGAIDERRVAILKSLTERSLLTDQLRTSLEAAASLAALEDLYLPYRPKRRTRAMMAREKGLEPLADLLFQNQSTAIPATQAQAFVQPEMGVLSIEDALEGARDILAERISEDGHARARLRDYCRRNAVIRAKVLAGKEAEAAKFKDYFEWTEPLATVPSHRFLAMARGEEEKFLTVRLGPPEDGAISLLQALFVKGKSPAAEQVRLAVQDSYKRLLGPAMETEIRLETKQKADEAAIKVFADNVRELLLAAPLGRKNVLAIDPGFRTGCKVVCLDQQGKLLHHEVIYPADGESRMREAQERVKALCQRYGIEAIAIGNGTAGRETEAFVRKAGLPSAISVTMVNESGASIYSASEVAREEFPDHDLTVRGAISIGRRLMDPLAELVKLDPKSIGVGQYQHDVDQDALQRSLDDTVMSCVNRVGVELNTASRQLLTYVSGLGPQLASNIVRYRDEHGPFRTRAHLRKVPRLGPKAFEQAAGFLRIRDGDEPLDASAVHPESYSIVEAMARDLKCAPSDLLRNGDLRAGIQAERYVTAQAGLPTLQDILAELAKPGRDPRRQFEAFQFKEGVEKIEDLRAGMKLPGIVTNVTAFGAFVDIGVHQDGLVHISQLADRFVKNPAEVVKVHQPVTVTVVEVDVARKRIGLSMRANPEVSGAKAPTEPRRSAPPTKPTTAPPAQDWFSEAMNRAKGNQR